MFFGKDAELNKNIFIKERNEILEPLLYNYLSYDYTTLSFNVPFVRKFLYFFMFVLIIIIGLLINKYFK